MVRPIRSAIEDQLENKGVEFVKLEKRWEMDCDMWDRYYKAHLVEKDGRIVGL